MGELYRTGYEVWSYTDLDQGADWNLIQTFVPDEDGRAQAVKLMEEMAANDQDRYYQVICTWVQETVIADSRGDG